MECNAKRKTPKEAEFWKSMIKKHEDRNAQLVEQQCDLRHRLEAMECSMPGLLCFNMMQLAKNKPGADLTNFVSQLQQPAEKQSGSLNLDCTCDPCPQHLLNEASARAFEPRPRTENQPDSIDPICTCSPCPSDQRRDFINETYDWDSQPVKGPNTKEQDFGGIACNTDSPSQPPTPPNTQNCGCDTVKRTNDVRPSFNFDALSAYSLKPTDINYMERIKSLVEREKLLKYDIEELEHKEQAYTETLKQADEMFATGPDHGDLQSQSLSYANQQLMDSNRDLEEQLEDAKLELKQAKENLEGPLKREIEKERRRCQQLEEQLRKATATQSDKENAHRKELDFLNKQLRSANQNLSDLNVLNKRLKEELCMLNCRCNELQTDLINQKLSEVHTISRLTAMNQTKPGDGKPKPPRPPGPPSPPKGPSGEGDDLNTIARNLSIILAEATDCNNCQNFNPDLIDTVKYIKSLVDIVNKDAAVIEEPISEEKVDLKPTVELYPPKEMPSSESTVGLDAELDVEGKIPSKKSSGVESPRSKESIAKSTSKESALMEEQTHLDEEEPVAKSEDALAESLSKATEELSAEAPTPEEEPQAITGDSKEASIGPEVEAVAGEEPQPDSVEEGLELDAEVTPVAVVEEISEADVVPEADVIPEDESAALLGEVLDEEAAPLPDEVPEDEALPLSAEIPEEEAVPSTVEVSEYETAPQIEVSEDETAPQIEVVSEIEELPPDEIAPQLEELPPGAVVPQIEELPPGEIVPQIEEIPPVEFEPPPIEPLQLPATPPSSMHSAAVVEPIEESEAEKSHKEVSKEPSMIKDAETIEQPSKTPSKVPSLREEVTPSRPGIDVDAEEQKKSIAAKSDEVAKGDKIATGEPVDKPEVHKPRDEVVVKPAVEDARKPSADVIKPSAEVQKPTVEDVTKPSTEAIKRKVPSVISVESSKSGSGRSVIIVEPGRVERPDVVTKPVDKAVVSMERVVDAAKGDEKLPSKPVSRESLKSTPSKPASRRPSKLSEKKPSETVVSTAHVREDVKVLKSSEKILGAPAAEEIEVITELETKGDLIVDTEVHLVRRSTDGVFVTTTVTSSGQLQVMTEGPAGVIDTTLKLTDSGNIEVVTEVTEYDEGTSAVISHSAKAIDAASIEASKPVSPPSAKSRTSSERSSKGSAKDIDVLHPPPPDDKRSEGSIRSRRSSKIEEGAPSKDTKGVCPCPPPKQMSDKSVTIMEPLETPTREEIPGDEIVDLTSDKLEEEIHEEPIDEAAEEIDVEKEDKEMEAIPEQSEINVQSDEPEKLAQDDKPTETDGVDMVEGDCQCEEEKFVEVDVCICDGETETPAVDKYEVICQCDDGDKVAKETETTNVAIADINLQYDDADKHVCKCDRGVETQARSKEAFSQAQDVGHKVISAVVVPEVEPEDEFPCDCDDEEDDENDDEKDDATGDAVTAGDDVVEDVEEEEEDEEEEEEGVDECVCKPSDVAAESDNYCKCSVESEMNLPNMDRKSVGFVNESEDDTGSGSTASDVSLFSDIKGAIELGPNIANVLERASARVSGVLERAGLELESVLNENRRSGILKNSQINIVQSEMTGDSKAVCTCSKKTGKPKREKRKRKREKIDKVDAPKAKRSKTRKPCTCKSKSTDISTSNEAQSEVMRARRPISPTFSGPSNPTIVCTCASEMSKSGSICTCRPHSPERRIVCICRPSSPDASQSSKSRSICTCRSSSPDSTQRSRSSCTCGNSRSICKCRPGSPDTHKSKIICTCRPVSPDAKNACQSISQTASQRCKARTSYKEQSNICKCGRRTRRDDPDSMKGEVLPICRCCVRASDGAQDSSTDGTAGHTFESTSTTYCKDTSDATTTTANSKTVAKCVKETCPEKSQTDSTIVDDLEPDVQDTSTNTLKTRRTCTKMTCEHKKSQTEYLTSSEGDSDISDVPQSRKIPCPAKMSVPVTYSVRPCSAGAIRSNATSTSTTKGISCKRCSSFSVQQSSSTVETMDDTCVSTCSRYAQKPSAILDDSKFAQKISNDVQKMQQTSSMDDECEPSCSKFLQTSSSIEQSRCPQESSSVEYPCSPNCPRFEQKTPSDEYPCLPDCLRFLQKSQSFEYPCPSNCPRFANEIPGKRTDSETFHTPLNSISHFELPPKLDLSGKCTASTCQGIRKKLDLTTTCTASTCAGAKSKKSPAKPAIEKKLTPPSGGRVLVDVDIPTMAVADVSSRSAADVSTRSDADVSTRSDADVSTRSDADVSTRSDDDAPTMADVNIPTMMVANIPSMAAAVKLADSLPDSPNDSPLTDTETEEASSSSSGCRPVTCKRVLSKPPILTETSSEPSTTAESSESVCRPGTCQRQQVIIQARPSGISKTSSQRTQPSGKSSKSETFATPTGTSETCTAEPPPPISDKPPSKISPTGSSKLLDEIKKSSSSIGRKTPSKIPSKVSSVTSEGPKTVVSAVSSKAPSALSEETDIPSRIPSVASEGRKGDVPSVASEARKTSTPGKTPSATSEGRKIVAPSKTPSVTSEGRKLPAPTKIPSVIMAGRTSTAPSKTPSATEPIKSASVTGDGRKTPSSQILKPPAKTTSDVAPKAGAAPKSYADEPPASKSVSKEQPLPSEKAGDDRPKISDKPLELDRPSAKELPKEMKKDLPKTVPEGSAAVVTERSPTKDRSRTSSIKSIPKVPKAASAGKIVEPGRKKPDVHEIEVTVTVENEPQRKYDTIAISIEREIPVDEKGVPSAKRTTPSAKPVGEVGETASASRQISRRSSKQSITKVPSKTPTADKPSKKAGDVPPTRKTSEVSRKSAGEVSKASSRRKHKPGDSAIESPIDASGSQGAVCEPCDMEQPEEDRPKTKPEEPPDGDLDGLPGEKSSTRSVEVVKMVADLDEASEKRSSRSGKDSKIPVSGEAAKAPSVKSALSAKSVPSVKSAVSTGAEGDSKAKTPSMKSGDLDVDDKSKTSSAKLTGGSKSKTVSSESLDRKSSKIPVPVSKTGSQASHPSICDCVECIFEKTKQLVRPVETTKPHAADCLCIDCLCDPSKFSPVTETVVPVLYGETLAAEPDIKKHSSSCNCIDCLCDPCREADKPKKSQHSKDCDCVDCLCNPCVEEPCPSLNPPKPKRHPPECKCVKCVCDPCGDMPECSCKICKCKLCGDVTKRLTKSGKKRHPDCRCPECICETCQSELACTCPDCQCDPCKDEEVQAKNLVKRGHGPACTCPVCKCQPCADINAVPHDPNCDCAMCVCDPCYEAPPKESKSRDVAAQNETQPVKSEAKVQTVSEEKRQAGAQVSMSPKHGKGCLCPECVCEPGESPKKHAPTCTCPDCICEPCSDPIVEGAKKNKHGGNCDCAECKCAPCGDAAVENAKTQPASTHGPSCTCPQCICDPCSYPMKKHGAGCKCPECICEPCTDPIVEGAKKSKHGTNCDCAECKCAPCGDPAKHGPNCKCPDCICAPCSDPTVASKRPNKHGEGCQCPECICGPCTDPSIEDAKKHPPVEKTKHTPTCRCPECTCDPCSDPTIKGKVKHVPNCKCPECTCDPCSDPLSKLKSKHSPDCDCPECVADAHPPSCTCPECKCDPCSDPAVQGANKHGKGCKCEKCTCDPCDPRGQPSLATKHGPNCKCPECICGPCTDSSIEDAKKRPPVGKTKHSPTCSCPKCICDPCSDPSVKGKVKHVPNCKCPECICDPCSDPLSKFKPNADAHPPSCDCFECKCNPCADPAVQGAKKHDKGCKCEKCDPPGQPSPATKRTIICKPAIQSKHVAGCKCPRCICTEPPVHEPECKCAICMCKPCDPSNKQTSKAKSVKEQPSAIARDDATLSAIPEECICVTPSKKGGKSSKGRRQEEVEELKGLMDQIRCACEDAELQATMTAPSPFKTTLSGMQMALNSLQDKCKTKDKMIEAMAQELKLRANSNVFNEMLRQMASSPNVAVDYDRQTICDVLPRPALEPPKPQSEVDCSCDLMDTSPMKITNVRRISPDSILVKWDQPANKSVNGYEICVDGAVKSRVHSAQRTSAVVFTLEMKNKVNLSVYAVTPNGRCSTPATYVYNV